MMLADLLFLVLVGYLLYRFIYGFVVPLMRASRQVREQFRNMQRPSNDSSGYEESQRHSGTQRPHSGAQQPRSGGSGPKRGFKAPAEDYIDFEEIK
ncbi:MAG TPA: DUF4834 family protein [Puia sp.]|nr:DUF4834 family protein [Puia sp.]